MNKLINFISIILFLFLPIIVKAQPEGEGWIRLGDRLENNYTIQDMSDKPSNSKWNQEIVPKKSLALVSKLAFKKIDKELFQESKLHLKKINKVEGTEFIYDPQEIIVTNGFEIQIGNKKIKSKELPKNKEGWLIYDIEDPAVILSVTDLNNQYNWNSAILKNIFLYLDPEKNPASKIEQAQQEAREKERQEFLMKLYTTPQEKGWTPVRTDNLADGTIVEHYDEGVRLYKKPNGDFISFIQPEDTRDPKTLDVIKGMDRNIREDDIDRIWAKPIGAFRITHPSGFVISGNGLTGEISFNNGNKLFSDNDESLFKKNEIMKLKNGMLALPFVFPISYDTFMEYFTYSKTDNRFFRTRAHEGFMTPTDFERRFNENNVQYFENRKPLKFVYLEDNKENEILLIKISDTFYFAEPISDKVYQVYYPTSTSLSPYGLFKGEPYSSNSIRLPIPSKLKQIDGDNFYFENGDFLKYDRGIESAHITLDDGTVLEKFPESSNYKVTLPNGEKYVGELDFNHAMKKAWQKEELPFQYDGYYTTSDGKEYTYGEYDSKIKKAKQEEEYKKLVAKYGKTNVDAASKGDIRVGMSLQMLKDLGVYIIKNNEDPKDGTYLLVTGFEDYMTRMKYKVFTVNLSTGKIVQIGKEQISAK